jgi:transposase
MIEEDLRKGIHALHESGMGLREIARRLGVSRNTVRGIVGAEGARPKIEKRYKLALDEELLRGLYTECGGFIARVHEKLLEQGIKVAYPTLTHRLRALGISPIQKQRCAEVPDEPGAEMQHDTSVYQVALAGEKVRLIASLIYLRYSKRKYLRFYRRFNRFRMKCFFHEALSFWQHAAPSCIIDNTNLARLSGTGRRAVIAPEMAAFAKQYGFEYACHEVNHSDRKAGEERSFWTVETNFFPGRSFTDLEDLNAQALAWATVRMEQRRQGKTRVIPAAAFVVERPLLRAVSAHLPPPYLVHHRGIDQYGYVPFDGNYYWVPGAGRGEVTVLEYAKELEIHREHERLAGYRLPSDGVKNEKFSPAGQPKPRWEPQRRRGSEAEEKHLRALGEGAEAYLDFALQQKGYNRHEFIRKLLGLARRMSAELFNRSVERARKYKILDVATIERIALLQFKEAGELPVVEVDESFRERETYRQGSITDPPDLSIYD